MQSLDAPATSLWLHQTSSDNLFGVSNLAVLRTDIANCWLEMNIQSGLLQSWNAILFQLLYGSSIYRAVCLILHIKLGIISPVEYFSLSK
jgi:hypothetical protein